MEEKKESWIAKLIELLNEYEKEKNSEYYEWEKWIWWPFLLFRRDTYDEEWSHLYSDTADTYVISKKYWFIKRLVENEKIDFKKHDWYNYLENPIWSNNYDVVWDYKTIIQRLAISDTPIDDLILYLK